MRRFITLLVVLLLCLPLAGCGAKNTPPEGLDPEPGKDIGEPGDKEPEPGRKDGIQTVSAGPNDLVALVTDAKGIFSGYINTQGQWVIAPDYLAGTQFSGGLAAVCPKGKDGNWQIIDKTGAIQADCGPDVQFVAGASFCEGLMRIHKEEDSAFGPITTFGFANTRGEIIVQPIYQWVEDFREGMAAVEQNGLWGYVDTQGNLAVPCQFSVGHSFSCGRAYVGNNSAFIDKTGAVIIQRAENDRDMVYEQFEGDFQDGVALCTCSGDRIRGRGPGLVNNAGLIVWFDHRGEYGSPWTGKIHNENIFLVEVRAGDKEGFIDTAGNLVCTVPEGYKLLNSGFSDGLCCITEPGSRLLGYMDKAGRVAIPAIYEGAEPFVNGYAAVRDVDGNYFYIDKAGAALSGDFTCRGEPFTR